MQCLTTKKINFTKEIKKLVKKLESYREKLIFDREKNLLKKLMNNLNKKEFLQKIKSENNCNEYIFHMMIYRKY